MKLFAIICSEFLATIPNILFAVHNQASLATSVKWQRETNPVLFGKNVTLTCMVDRQEGCDNTITRRWDAGPDRHILLLNGYSTNPLKYYELSEEPCENFSLVIMKFDVTDVNLEYWCSFGFDTSRQMLMLDDRNFIGIPAKPDMYSYLENDKRRELHLDISFKVYPKPKCMIKIGDTSWLPVTVVSHRTGILYISSVHYKTTFPRSQCHTNVTTICSLLSHTILQLNKRLNCTDEVVNREKKNSMLMVIIPVLMVVGYIIIGCACFMRIKRNSKARPKQIYSNEEMQFLKIGENKE